MWFIKNIKYKRSFNKNNKLNKYFIFRRPETESDYISETLDELEEKIKTDIPEGEVRYICREVFDSIFIESKWTSEGNEEIDTVPLNGKIDCPTLFKNISNITFNKDRSLFMPSEEEKLISEEGVNNFKTKATLASGEGTYKEWLGVIVSNNNNLNLKYIERDLKGEETGYSESASSYEEIKYTDSIYSYFKRGKSGKFNYFNYLKSIGEINTIKKISSTIFNSNNIGLISGGGDIDTELKKLLVEKNIKFDSRDGFLISSVMPQLLNLAKLAKTIEEEWKKMEYLSAEGFLKRINKNNENHIHYILNSEHGENKDNYSVFKENKDIKFYITEISKGRIYDGLDWMSESNIEDFYLMNFACVQSKKTFINEKQQQNFYRYVLKFYLETKIIENFGRSLIFPRNIYLSYILPTSHLYGNEKVAALAEKTIEQKDGRILFTVRGPKTRKDYLSSEVICSKHTKINKVSCIGSLSNLNEGNDGFIKYTNRINESFNSASVYRLLIHEFVHLFQTVFIENNTENLLIRKRSTNEIVFEEEFLKWVKSKETLKNFYENSYISKESLENGVLEKLVEDMVDYVKEFSGFFYIKEETYKSQSITKLKKVEEAKRIRFLVEGFAEFVALKINQEILDVLKSYSATDFEKLDEYNSIYGNTKEELIYVLGIGKVSLEYQPFSLINRKLHEALQRDNLHIFDLLRNDTLEIDDELSIQKESLIKDKNVIHHKYFYIEENNYKNNVINNFVKYLNKTTSRRNFSPITGVSAEMEEL